MWLLTTIIFYVSSSKAALDARGFVPGTDQESWHATASHGECKHLETCCFLFINDTQVTLHSFRLQIVHCTFLHLQCTFLQARTLSTVAIPVASVNQAEGGM